MENMGNYSMVTKGVTDKNRFAYLDIIKFLMSIMIVLFHYNYFCMNYSNGYMVKGGYLAVEAFFVISGFLFYHSEVESGRYEIKTILGGIKHKLTGLYPAYLFSLMAAFGIDIAVNINNMTGTDFLRRCFRFCSDTLLIGEWGFPGIRQTYNIVTWYISALLFAYIVLLLLFKFFHNKEKHPYIILIVTFLIYGYLGLEAGNLHVHGNRTHILLMDGALRGIAGMGAGILAFHLYKVLGSVNIIYRKMIFFISLAGTTLVLFLAKDSLVDFVMIPCAMLLVASAATFSADKKLKCVSFLGKFSYFIYLNHLIVLDIMKRIMKEYSVLLYCCMVLLSSYFIMKIIEFLVNRIKSK